MEVAEKGGERTLGMESLRWKEAKDLTQREQRGRRERREMLRGGDVGELN
jgi:hypothetical protein